MERNRSEWSSKWRLWVDYLGPKGDWCRQELIDKSVLSLLGRIRGKTILDAGCGEGRLTRILAQQGAAVTGVDIVPEFIALAKATALNQVPRAAVKRWPWLSHEPKAGAAPGRQSYRLADITRLPRSFSRVYDAAVCCCSLNHVSDLSKAVLSLRRILKNNGVCIAVLPSPYHVLPCGRLTHHRLPVPCISFTERISPKLTITNIYRSFSTLINAFAEHGMGLDRVDEPLLDPAARRKWRIAISAFRRARELPDPETTPWFLIMRFRKVTR